MVSDTSCGVFPRIRLRRNRKSAWSRALIRENQLSASDLILPMFVREGKNTVEAIDSMPSVYRYTIDRLVKEVKYAYNLGIPAVALFPVVSASLKSDDVAEALNHNNLICRAISEIKSEVPDIGVIGDVALDPYTLDGQDGITVNGIVDNDKTVEFLCIQALTQAKAGCDIVAPSDMMDGRVLAIRNMLDDHGYTQVQVLSYAVKYASCFYGPFRDAIGSSAHLGKSSKEAYQMDPANSDEALREVEQDIKEGADMVMVKPGMPYLDIISRVSRTYNIPVFAYQVSGEYTMIKAAAAAGVLDESKAFYESLIGFKRAGASAILTYAACEVAEYLQMKG